MENVGHVHGWADTVILLLYGVVGLLVRIVVDYYRHSRKVEKGGGTFERKAFVKKYDQDWILGGVVVLAIAVGGDYLYTYILGPLAVRFELVKEVPPFAHELGILFGVFSTWIGHKLSFIVGGKE